jgi:hypothetical protein
MKIAHPFIQLPLKFDAARMAAEIAAIPEADWRPHPQNFPGNSMLPLIAVNGDPANESFAGPMRPTPELERCPYVMQAMAAVGVTAGRSRLMRLSGHAEVTQHADQGYYWVDRVRVHIPVLTQPSVRFECGDAAVNMAAGECWIFDTWRLHRVINDNDDQRIHLVMDTVGGAQFWDYVSTGQPTPGDTKPGWAPKLVPFDANAHPRMDFENRNVPDVMTPWEVETHLSFLIGEAGAHPQVANVRRAAAVFIRDWRALWAAHGDNAQARPIYRHRLQDFMETVGPSAGQVDMANEINLMGAIMAMIGKVAVAADAAPRAPADAAAMFDRA